MTVRKELLLTVKDLRFVQITCQGCGTQSRLDLSSFEKVGERNVFTPRSCAVCKMDFDRTLQSLDGIQERFIALADFGDRVTFCVEVVLPL